MSRLPLRFLAATVVIWAIGMLTGCGDTVQPEQTKYFVFSFEGSMEGWSKNGLDLESPAVSWEISINLDMARDSTSSVKFYLNNVNDKAKIYIERGFEVDTSTVYNVRVSYQFASRDWGQVNLWNIITGARTSPAASPADLVIQGGTSNGYEADVGPVWMYKSYEFANVTSSNAGKIYVQIGVWGSSEFARSYYVDAVYVVFTKK